VLIYTRWLLSKHFNEGISGEEEDAMRVLQSNRVLSLILDDKLARRTLGGARNGF